MTPENPSHLGGRLSCLTLGLRCSGATGSRTGDKGVGAEITRVNSELNLEFGQQLSAGAMADDGDNEGRVNIY